MVQISAGNLCFRDDRFGDPHLGDSFIPRQSPIRTGQHSADPMILNFHPMKSQKFRTCLLSRASRQVSSHFEASSGVASQFWPQRSRIYYAFAGVVAPFLIVSIFSNHYIERIGSHRFIIMGGISKRLAGSFLRYRRIFPSTGFFGPMALLSWFFRSILVDGKSAQSIQGDCGQHHLSLAMQILWVRWSALLAVFIDGTALPISLAIAFCGVASAGVYILYQNNKRPAGNSMNRLNIFFWCYSSAACQH